MADIAQNIAGRKHAEEILACAEIADQPDFIKAFWTTLRDKALAALPPVVMPNAAVPMTDAESKLFDREVIPFGKHQHHQVQTAPLSYLIWLAEPTDFQKELRRYLKSDRIKYEIEQLQGER